MTNSKIFIPAGGSYQLLTDGNTGRTYILIGQSLPLFTTPVLPSGWSVSTRFRANDYTEEFEEGATYIFLLDSDFNKYRVYVN